MYFARLSDAAQADVDTILTSSENDFGPQARLRYERLLAAALDVIQANPRHASVKERPDIGSGVRTLHLVHVRKKSSGGLGRVRRPRHLLVFRIDEPNLIVVGRVLHDAMELALHVPLELSPDADI